MQNNIFKMNKDIITMTYKQHMICQLSEPIAYNSSPSKASLQPQWPPHCPLNNPRMLIFRAFAVKVLSDLRALPPPNHMVCLPSYRSLFKCLFRVDFTDHLPAHIKGHLPPCHLFSYLVSLLYFYTAYPMTFYIFLSLLTVSIPCPTGT